MAAENRVFALFWVSEGLFSELSRARLAPLYGQPQPEGLLNTPHLFYRCAPETAQFVYPCLKPTPPAVRHRLADPQDNGVERFIALLRSQSGVGAVMRRVSDECRWPAG